MIFRVSDSQQLFATRNAGRLEMPALQLQQGLKERYADEESMFIELIRGAIQQRLTGKRRSIQRTRHEGRARAGRLDVIVSNSGRQ